MLTILARIGFFLRFAAVLVPMATVTAAPVQTNQMQMLDKRVVELYRAGKYEEAIALAERVLATREKALPAGHPDIAKSLSNLGSLYQAQGRLADAEPLLKRALVIDEKALPAGHPDIATSLNNLAGLYHAQGRLAEAEPMYKRALRMRESALRPGHPDVATSLNNVAGVYEEQGRLAEAESYYKRALDIWEKAWPAGHPNIAKGLENLGGLYEAQGRITEAGALYKHALDVWEKVLPAGHPDVAQNLDKLADLYQSHGQLDEAEPLLKRALEMREKVLPAGDPHIAASLNNLAGLYHNQGRLAEAELLYKRALKIRENALSPSPLAISQSLTTLAFLYHGQGRFAEAEPLYKRALEIKDKALPSGHPQVATALDYLGFLYEGQGRFAEAEPLYKRALEISEKSLPATHPNIAASLDNLAYLYGAQGRLAEAEPLLKRALDILEKVLPAGRLALARSLNNLGMLYYRQGRLAEAEPLYKRALEIREEAPRAGAPEIASTLNNLASLYYKEGRLAEAEALHQRALASREKALPPNHPDIAMSLNNLAGLYYDKGDWTTATDYARRATAIIIDRAKLASQTIEGGVTETTRAEISQNAVLFDWLLHAGWRLSEQQPEHRAALSEETFIAAQWSLQTAAGAALAQMASRFARGEGELSRVVRDQQNLVALWQQLDKQIIATRVLPPEQRNAAAEAALSARLTATDRELVALDARLSKEFPDYAALAAPQPLSFMDTQKQLQFDEVLVLFAFPPGPEGFAWIISKTEFSWVRINLGERSLSSEVQALRCGLDEEEWSAASKAAECGKLLNLAELPDQSRPLPFHLEVAHRLYQALFGQIEELIKDKRLLVVPSGPLASLPFHVLVTEKPATAVPNTFEGYRNVAWLGRSRAITVLPTVASLQALRGPGAKGETATEDYIGYGNPVLEGGGSCRAAKIPDDACDLQFVAAQGRATIRGRGGRRAADLNDVFSSGATTQEVVEKVRALCPLPDTAYEIRCVAEHFRKEARAIRLDTSAREADIKALSVSGTLARYRIVHFATHGLLAGDVEAMAKRQGEPALVMTPPKEPQNADDDGLLTASEVAQLKLNADWVVLSACNTAASDRLGAEALSGLARAFFYARARALLVSHWPVYSDAAVRLTTRTFAELDRDPQTGHAEALQHAMIELMDDPSQLDNAHPAVWAPFVVVGEGTR